MKIRFTMYIIMCVLCCMILVCGCNNTDNNQITLTIDTTEIENTESEMTTTELTNVQTIEEITNEDNTVGNDNPITLEYVCNEFGIPESEFEGVDFEHFIEYYGLTWDNIEGNDMLYLLNRYKENDGEIEFFDYMYLYQFNDDATLTQDNQQNVVAVLCVKDEDLGHDSWILDFENNLKFYTPFPIDLVHRDQITAKLTSEDKEEVMDLFEKYDVYSWFERREELRFGDWNISVEFSDGTVAYISGESSDETMDFMGFFSEIQKIGE